MPVQDNDDKRTADQPAVDAEEELRRKQAQSQEQQQDETNVHKSGKLLPLLNAKAEHHQSRIDSLDVKIANQTDKIDRNKAKIEALSAKADKLEDTNRMLKATIGNLPGIGAIIANNEKRIQAIREVKIPNRQEKVDQSWKKIDALTNKRDRIEHKLNRVIALNDTIKSFGIHFNKERREAFADAMTRLNSSTVDCLSDKKATLEAKRQDILDTYNAPETSADEIEVENWLSDMLESGDAVLTDDGGFKVNPDYYKELPRNDRHVETMTEVQAVEVMSALTAAGVAYSATTKGEDKVGITVSKADVPVLNDVMYASIGKIAHTEAAKENGGKGEKGKYQTINPEYYASIGKEDKHTRVEPISTARQIVAELQKQNIPYSAVVRKNYTVAVTVSKANAQAYRQIERAVKGERAVEYVNPDFFKELPKQERFTQRMDEGQARKKSAGLTAKGVEHSAVFGGEKSAVTVAKKDSQRAFFSRGRMQRDAQRISGRGQHQKPQQREQTPKKRKNQGLG